MIVWWIHHRLFKSIFVLNTAMVIVNFAMLGALVLMVYFQQICVHLIAIGDDVTVAMQLWLVSYSVVYALLPSCCGTACGSDGGRFEDDLRWAFGRAALVSLGSLIFIAYAFIFKYRVHSSELFLDTGRLVIVAARFAVNGVVSRVISRRALIS